MNPWPRLYPTSFSEARAGFVGVQHLLLCFLHPEMFHNFLTRDSTFSFCAGPHKSQSKCINCRRFSGSRSLIQKRRQGFLGAGEKRTRQSWVEGTDLNTGSLLVTQDGELPSLNPSAVANLQSHLDPPHQGFGKMHGGRLQSINASEETVGSQKVLSTSWQELLGAGLRPCGPAPCETWPGSLGTQPPRLG